MSNERIGGFELDEEIETVFKVEPPLTPAPSNFGYIGVLLRNKETDKLQCHVCGEWHKSLSAHVIKHGVISKQYKEIFGLPKNFPLIGKDISAKMSKRAKSHKSLSQLKRARCNSPILNIKKKDQKSFYQTEAYLNSKGLCKKQIFSRYKIVENIVGRKPRISDLVEHDAPLWAAIRRRYDNKINKFREAYGVEVTEFEKRSGKGFISEEYVIAILRKKFKETGKVPLSTMFKYGRNKELSDSTIRKRFGSFRRALVKAGIL